MSINFLTSYAGTAHVTAEADAIANIGLYGNKSYFLGSFETLDANLVLSSGSTIIAQGRKVVINSDEYVLLPLSTSSSLKRKVVVGLSYTRNTLSKIESIAVSFVAGEEASNPVAPSVEPAQNINDIGTSSTFIPLMICTMTNTGISNVAMYSNVEQIDNVSIIKPSDIFYLPGDVIEISGEHACGYIAASSNSFGFFSPLSKQIKGNINITDLAVIVRHAQGGFPYVKSGSSGSVTTPLGSNSTKILENGSYVRNNEVDSITLYNRGNGVLVTVQLKYSMVKSGSSMAEVVTANTPIDVRVAAKFTVS